MYTLFDDLREFLESHLEADLAFGYKQVALNSSSAPACSIFFAIHDSGGDPTRPQILGAADARRRIAFKFGFHPRERSESIGARLMHSGLPRRDATYSHVEHVCRWADYTGPDRRRGIQIG